eukprot:TRINITY_DN1252_c0_g1_i3.p1 TRINITY_DN1252_c0_g1~~TRINITY_DN1252_c0_g1_i3.p1  ORF type:complete len:214 (+),score=40.78 TRINITY_DN1252_c0_g1_i3:89-730(+)
MSYAATEYDVLMKMVIVGDYGVGKSSLLKQFVDGEWSAECSATIGIDFRIDCLEVQGKLVKLQMWDSSGMDRYRRLYAAAYRNTDWIMLVFSLTDRGSFDLLPYRVREARDYTKEDMPIILVGNKSDLPGRVVTFDEADMFAADNGLDYIETSAKTASNVDAAFMQTTNTAMDERRNAAELERNRTHVISNEQPSCFDRWLSFFRRSDAAARM